MPDRKRKPYDPFANGLTKRAPLRMKVAADKRAAAKKKKNPVGRHKAGRKHTAFFFYKGKLHPVRHDKGYRARKAKGG